MGERLEVGDGAADVAAASSCECFEDGFVAGFVFLFEDAFENGNHGGEWDGFVFDEFAFGAEAVEFFNPGVVGDENNGVRRFFDEVGERACAAAVFVAG